MPLSPTSLLTERKSKFWAKAIPSRKARLRIVTNRPLNEYPESPAELEKLARRMGLASDERRTAGERFLRELERHARAVREAFDRLVQL